MCENVHAVAGEGICFDVNEKPAFFFELPLFSGRFIRCIICEEAVSFDEMCVERKKMGPMMSECYLLVFIGHDVFL